VSDGAGVSLGARIRMARTAMGLTQQQLCGRDFSRAYISLLEHGRLMPSLKSLGVLATRLRKPVSYFLEGLQRSSTDVLLLTNLGIGFLRQNEPSRAVPYLREALKISVGLGDERLQGIVFKNLGWLYRSTEHYGAAQAAYRRALALLADGGATAEYAETLMSFGTLSRVQGRYADAARTYEKALAVLRDASPRARGLEMRLTKNLGTVYGMLGDHDSALAMYRRALKLTGEARDPRERAIVYMGLAVVNREKGRLDEALQCSMKAMEAFRLHEDVEMVADLHYETGTIEARRGKWPSAHRHLQQSIVLFERLGLHEKKAWAFMELAAHYREEGDLENAERLAREALDLTEGLDEPIYVAQALALLGEIALEAGRPIDALGPLQQAHRLFQKAGMLGEAERTLALADRAVAGDRPAPPDEGRDET